MSSDLSTVKEKKDAPTEVPPSAEPPARLRRQPWRRHLATVVPPVLVLALVLACWQAASLLLFRPDRRFLLPPPTEVVRISFFDPVSLAELLDALGRSTLVALTGLGIAVLLGCWLAILMSQALWVERSLYPYAVFLQTVPILALVPLLGFWFGFGFGSRVLVCVLIALFPIIANTLFGLRSVDRSHHDLFSLHRAGRWTRLVKLQLPAALPSLLTGLRISAGLSVIGSIVGDQFFRQGDPGLGLLIDLYRARLQTEQMFGAVIVSALLGLVVFWAFGLLGKWAVGTWHESARAPESFVLSEARTRSAPKET